MENKSKFDKISNEIFGINYEELTSLKMKNFVISTLINKYNTIYCPYCGQEDHNNNGICKFCGVNIHKKINDNYIDIDGNILNINGHNNIIIQDTNNKNNCINISGNKNIIAQKTNNSNINININ